MKNVYQHKDSHLNPQTMLLLAQISRQGGRGATAATVVFNTLFLASDENGEVTATRSALAGCTSCSLAITSAAVKRLVEVGLIEYRLSRAKSGSLFRLNPHAISVGKKYQHRYVELVNSETGEITKKREVEFTEEYKRLCRRYNGNQLNKKMIAAEKKLLDGFVETSSQLFKR